MRLFHPVVTAFAHCDLPCGVYDPAQARIEAESVKAIMEKVPGQRGPGVPHPGAVHQGATRGAGQAPPVGAVDGLLQAARTSRSTRSCMTCSTGPPRRPGPPAAKARSIRPKARNCST